MNVRHVTFILVLLELISQVKNSVDGIDDNSIATMAAGNRFLSRKKRLLLFPVSGQVVITVSGAKAMIYKGPGGGFAILEMDMYYPLPDYRYRFSQLRLGEIAMLPSVAPPPAKNMTTTTPMPISSDDHHDGHEVSPEEVKQYLKDHPDTWVPPGYGKDRSDRFHAGTYYPYENTRPQRLSFRRGDSVQNDRYIPLNKRSPDQPDLSDSQLEFEEDEDRFNISHHRDWEHFHHYRERREFFHTLESGFGSKFGFSMKSCIMRAICEARGLLLPRGKSMVTDIVRLILSVPLKQDLHDEYSNAMRDERADCREVYGQHCPVSLLYLFLLGKFVP